MQIHHHRSQWKKKMSKSMIYLIRLIHALVSTSSFCICEQIFKICLFEKNHTTMLNFVQGGSTSSTTSKHTALEQVSDALSALNLKVDNIYERHRTLEQLACEDSEVRRSSNLRKILNSWNGSTLERQNAASCYVFHALSFLSPVDLHFKN